MSVVRANQPASVHRAVVVRIAAPTSPRPAIGPSAEDAAAPAKGSQQ